MPVRPGVLDLNRNPKLRKSRFPGLGLIFFNLKADVSVPVSSMRWKALIVARRRLRLNTRQHGLIEFERRHSVRLPVMVRLAFGSFVKNASASSRFR